MKRWLIRSFFIGLLLLCVGGWVVSYKYGWCVHHGNGDDNYNLSCFRGRIRGLWLNWGGTSEYIDDVIQGWSIQVAPTHLIEIPHGTFTPIIHNNLFGLTMYFRNEDGCKFVVIPFWFPAAISAALLWLVWRKTRPKINPAKAFPVEVATKKVEP